MVEKLRRRVRGRVLRALTSAGGLLPTPLVRGALLALSPLARFSTLEALVRGNLELALGTSTTPEERSTIAAGVRRHAARQFTEWLRLARGAPPEGPGHERGAWIDALVQLDASIAVLDEALAAGRGAIVVTAHLGNWELLAARLRRRGHTGAAVGFERPNDSSFAWLTSMRRAYGMATISQHSSPRELLRVLGTGGVLGILADLEVRRIDGEFLPFFGHPALTITAPAALARASGAPLVPMRCVLVGGKYRLRCEPAIHFDSALDRASATTAIGAQLNAAFERWIREHPEQWAWHQPRWRSQPGAFEPHPLAARRGTHSSLP